MDSCDSAQASKKKTENLFLLAIASGFSLDTALGSCFKFDRILVTTRLSYSHHKHAKAALKAVQLACPKICAAEHQALPAFAQLCFDALAGKSHLLPETFARQLIDLVKQSAKLRSDKPLWLVQSETVMHLSERLLGMAGDQGVANESIVVHRVRRKDCGTYSTPNHIVDNLVERVFKELARLPESRSHLDVVDLSAEAGHFALATFACGQRPAVRFHAFDRDPEAVGLNRIILENARRLTDLDGFAFRSLQKESVLGAIDDLVGHPVDAVIGNPPWKTLHPTDGKRLAASYGPILRARFDVYLAFILRADQLLRADGILGMVLPSAFLYNDSGSGIRSLLLDLYDPIYLATYPRTAFIEYRGVAPVAIILRKKSAGASLPAPTRIEIFRSLDETALPAASHSVNAGKEWSRNSRAVFGHHSVVPVGSGLEEHRRTSLTQLGVFSSGAKLSARRMKATDLAFLGIGARNLAPFHVDREAAISFAQGAALFDRPPPVQFLPAPKVFFQTVRCVSMAKRLVAAVGQAGQLACSTAAMYIPFEPNHVDFISGLLNSSFANVWYKSRDHNHSIKISVLNGLEIPIDLRLWSEIGRCSRELSTLQTRLRGGVESSKVDYDDQIERIDRESAIELRDRLDDLVFELYSIDTADQLRLKALSVMRSF